MQIRPRAVNDETSERGGVSPRALGRKPSWKEPDGLRRPARKPLALRCVSYRSVKTTSLLVVAFLITGLGTNTSCWAEPPRSLIEIKVGKEQFSGRIVAADDRDCWVFQRDGRMSRVRMDDVDDCSEVDPRFRPFPSLELRDRLKTEFGRDFEVKATSHYIVVARNESAERYAKLFEQVYRQFHSYFVPRGFRMEEPEFPLVAVVFPDQASFTKYCRAEGANPKPGVVGFYLPVSNRVALYDRTTSGRTRDDDTNDTVIHEATHQVAFNTGVHSRIGQSPQWVVEGLATLFESDGIRAKQSGGSSLDRINPERFEWFQTYRRQRRVPASLESFVRNDSAFQRAALDAYGEAWALTFYLAESRSAELAAYLRSIAARDPLKPYTAAERLQDFRAAFGADLTLIESGFLRFHDRLAK